MKKIILTGVSEGLGREIAKIFTEKNIQVVGLSRKKPDIKNIIHIPTDLENETSISNAIQEIKKNHGDFDAIINCAGILSIDTLENIDYQNIEKVFKVNVFAPISVVSGLTGIIKKQGADIVNISSTVGLKAYPEQCIYGASKWSLRGVTENFQLEFKSTPTRVIGIHPGGFKSKLFEKATGESPDLENFMEPKDLANFIVSVLELPKNIEISHVVINRK